MSSTDEHGANDDEDIDIDALVGVSSDDDDLAPSPGADVAELERLFAASDRAMPSMKRRSHSREDSVDGNYIYFLLLILKPQNHHSITSKSFDTSTRWCHTLSVGHVG